MLGHSLLGAVVVVVRRRKRSRQGEEGDPASPLHLHEMRAPPPPLRLARGILMGRVFMLLHGKRCAPPLHPPLHLSSGGERGCEGGREEGGTRIGPR